MAGGPRAWKELLQSLGGKRGVVGWEGIDQGPVCTQVWPRDTGSRWSGLGRRGGWRGECGVKGGICKTQQERVF